MHQYSINIYWSDDDRVFIAEVPDLPGCVTHGNTHALALANAYEAIQMWINTAREFGDPVPSPKAKSVITSAGLRSKKRPLGERLHQKRRNNPRITLSVGGPKARTNPKAH
jgi:predicted RNase H-like HicB family nuclease